MLEIWSVYISKSGKAWFIMNDDKNACVELVAGVNGFLWSYKKKYGYAETISEAMEWVEVMADHFSIAPKDRWLTI